MNIIAVDDEVFALKQIESQLQNVQFVTAVKCFSKGTDAVRYAQWAHPDAALLDIDMYDVNGLELAVMLKKDTPDIKIIFLTGYSQYAIDAMRIHAHGYLLKPASDDEVVNELRFWLAPPEPKEEQSERVVMRTFGNFEVLYHGEPVKFKRTKTKEMLAYLVDKAGTSVSTTEMICALWEDKEIDRTSRSMLSNLIADCISTLKSIGQDHIVEKHYGTLMLKPDEVECDLFRFQKGDVEALNSYTGQYMSNYSWAETTNGYLDRYAKT